MAEPRSRAGKTVWSALLLASLLCGAFDLHRKADAFGTAAWSSRVTTASHGGRTPHLCAADVLVQRPCSACLYRLETSGAHLLPAAPPAAIAAQGFVWLGRPTPAGRIAVISRPARGPPSC
jgi:hypothetical protein